MSILTYNQNKITQRPEDGFLNATEMAKANNTDTAQWLRNNLTKKYLKALQESESAKSQLVVKKESIGFPAKQTVWVHPLAALHFGRWLSPKFAIWCDTHIKTLMETGKTTIEEIKEQFQLPGNYVEALEALVTAEKDKQALKGQIELDRPKVEFAEAIEAAETSIPVNMFAKMIDMGRNTLFKELRERKILMTGNIPYQRFLNQGYFEVTEVRSKIGIHPVTKITGKGQLWLTKELKKPKTPAINLSIVR